MGLKRDQVDDIYHPDTQVGEVLTKMTDRCQCFQGGHVAGIGHDHVGLAAPIIAGPFADADPGGAVLDCLVQKTVWHDRHRSIANLERHLHSNGTRIIKFYLHLSKEEQRKRFLQRIDEPEKNWKFSLADVEERKFWRKYMKAYEECLNQTSTRDAPWYVVPADDEQNARLIVSRIVLDTLEGLKMTYPKTSEERRQELQAIRRQLVTRGCRVRRQLSARGRRPRSASAGEAVKKALCYLDDHQVGTRRAEQVDEEQRWRCDEAEPPPYWEKRQDDGDRDSPKSHRN
jgi:Polyphosphate kinase 2 (PPK2)